MTITLNSIVTAIALSSTALVAAAQTRPAGSTREDFTRELAFEGGVLLAPGEIGRDVSAGGDVLVARLGSGGLFGGRLEIHNGLVGGVVGLFAGPRSIAVTSERGVEFPGHGQAPAMFLLEGRLYPLGRALARGRVSPYVAAGAGGALLSVDLDNINGQELRNLWMRTAGGGMKITFKEDRAFVDVQFKTCDLSGRGPIASFGMQAIAVAIGGRY